MLLAGDIGGTKTGPCQHGLDLSQPATLHLFQFRMNVARSRER